MPFPGTKNLQWFPALYLLVGFAVFSAQVSAAETIKPAPQLKSSVSSATPKKHRTARRAMRSFSHWRLGVVGVYFTSLFQPLASGNTYAPLLVYVPEYRFDRSTSLLLDVGVSVLNSPRGIFPTLFLGTRMRLTVSRSWALDAGGGIQYWGSEGGLLFMAGGGASYAFRSPLFGFIRNLRGSVDYIFNPRYPTFQALIGIEINLGNLL